VTLRPQRSEERQPNAVRERSKPEGIRLYGAQRRKGLACASAARSLAQGGAQTSPEQKTFTLLTPILKNYRFVVAVQEKIL